LLLVTLPKKEPNAYLHDRHYIEGATRHALANAHEKDLQAQSKYGVSFLTDWFDEARSTAFCLVEAPRREAIQRTHEEAHGAVPNEIIEVDPTVVEAFLGRLTDPLPSESGAGKVSVELKRSCRSRGETLGRRNNGLLRLYRPGPGLRNIHSKGSRFV
jgi:Protein of unknown function (DUF4242)